VVAGHSRRRRRSTRTCRARTSGSGTRCSTLGQELGSQLDALSKHGIPRDKVFSEKISTRVRVRPAFEEALRTAREVKAHAPHCRVILTVYEMKRLGSDAAELSVPRPDPTPAGVRGLRNIGIRSCA
jgi:Resolvase, N terminal domain